MKGSDRCHADDAYCTLGGQTLRVSNLSPGGLFACSHAPPELGETVVLDVLLPRRTLHVEGVVAWVNPPASPRTFSLSPGFGLRFSLMGTADRRALVDYIRKCDTVLREDDRGRVPQRANGR
jgi:uncharacterized protein (TIGR02266 family)